MFGLGVPEMLLILVIVVLIFGAGRLPRARQRHRRGNPQLQAVDPRRRAGRRRQEGLTALPSPSTSTTRGPLPPPERSPGGEEVLMKKTALIVWRWPLGHGLRRLRQEDPPPAPPPPPPVAPEAAAAGAAAAARSPSRPAGRRVRAPQGHERRTRSRSRASWPRSSSTSTRPRSARRTAPTLSKNADALKKFDFLKVTVEGHCDERGTVEYNLALGERRAKAAYDYLVSLGRPRGAPEDRLLRQGGPGLHGVQRGLLAEEPPRPLHGDRQDAVDRRSAGFVRARRCGGVARAGRRSSHLTPLRALCRLIPCPEGTCAA